jgi:hypothetical protein
MGGQISDPSLWCRTIITLLDRLDARIGSELHVIPWACPIPGFGDISGSVVATVGLNPSNREFVDDRGAELQGGLRRFPTLGSLGLTGWAEADASHVRRIIDACSSYFVLKPYVSWFNVLNQVLSGIRVSYYGGGRQASHLDLIPYATSTKWMSLSADVRRRLLLVSADVLSRVIQESTLRVLVLNGQSVVTIFEKVSGIRLERYPIAAWSLERSSARHVQGVAYTKLVNSLFGAPLGREVLILGFNHNLQSSFGVTRTALVAIRDWIAERAGVLIG